MPIIKFDGELLGYNLKPRYCLYWFNYMKNIIIKSSGQILVFGMHTHVQMMSDPELKCLYRFLRWLENFKEEYWLGSLDMLWNYIRTVNRK